MEKTINKKAPTKGAKKRNKLDRVLLTRILCGVLAAIMLLSLFYTAIMR